VGCPNEQSSVGCHNGGSHKLYVGQLGEVMVVGHTSCKVVKRIWSEIDIEKEGREIMNMQVYTMRRLLATIQS